MKNPRVSNISSPNMTPLEPKLTAQKTQRKNRNHIQSLQEQQVAFIYHQQPFRAQNAGGKQTQLNAKRNGYSPESNPLSSYRNSNNPKRQPKSLTNPNPQTLAKSFDLGHNNLALFFPSQNESTKNQS